MKNCFIIAPIGEEGSDIRKRSDQIFKHVIQPACAECGYKPERADHISDPGIITSQIIQRIVEDPLVIADLTGRNPNVYYELSLRHALRKPLVQIVKKGETLPFDVAGMRSIPVDHHDLDSVEEAKNEIIKQIRSVENKTPQEIETPISVSLELQNLRQSENPEERSLGELLSLISELKSDIGSVEEKLNNPEKILPPNYIRQVIREYGMMRGRISPRAYEELEYIIHKTRKALELSNSNIDSEETLMRLKELSYILQKEIER